jgi:hypothetical protein
MKTLILNINYVARLGKKEKDTAKCSEIYIFLSETISGDKHK